MQRKGHACCLSIDMSASMDGGVLLEVCRVHDALIILATDLNCHGFCEVIVMLHVLLVQDSIE